MLKSNLSDIPAVEHVGVRSEDGIRPAWPRCEEFPLQSVLAPSLHHLIATVAANGKTVYGELNGLAVTLLQVASRGDQPKWRVSSKPGGASAGLQGFADEAYAECFPSMADYGVVEDEEEDPKKAKAAAAAAAAAGGAAGGKGGRGGGSGSGMDDMERKLNHKLSREVQQMQGIFKDKGWGSDAAFKKEDKLDAVAATPARKRLRI